MRLASFNVENLCNRAKALNLDNWAVGKEILTEYDKLTTILQQHVSSASCKTELLASLDKLALKQKDDAKVAILRQNRGHLLKRPTSGPVEVIADGRGDWVGWVELKTEAVNEIATQ